MSKNIPIWIMIPVGVATVVTLVIFTHDMKWSCDNPHKIGNLSSLTRGVCDSGSACTKINLDNGREFFVHGDVDATLPALMSGRSISEGDTVLYKDDRGCGGAYVSFGDKDYWYYLKRN